MEIRTDVLYITELMKFFATVWACASAAGDTAPTRRPNACESSVNILWGRMTETLVRPAAVKSFTRTSFGPALATLLGLLVIMHMTATWLVAEP